MKLTDYIGETTSYDKKVALERKDPLSWLKSVSAFANTFGGKLLYGVGDDGELVGLSDAERDAEDLSEIIKSCLDPVPTFKLEFVREESKTFMVVSIQAGDEAPYYVFLKGHRDAYVRVGNESVKASSIDLKRLVLKGEKRSWDSLQSSFNKENSDEPIYGVSWSEVRAIPKECSLVPPSTMYGILFALCEASERELPDSVFDEIEAYRERCLYFEED